MGAYGIQYLDRIDSVTNETDIIFMDMKNQVKNIVHAYRHFLQDLNGSNVFEKLLSTAARFTDADRATIFIDPKYNSPDQNHKLKAILATGLKNSEIVVDIEHGIVGHVFRTKQSYFTNDVQKDPHFYAGIDKQTGYKTKSTMAVPLWFKNQSPIGVLQVLNNKQEMFTENDLLILELLSIFSTMALDYLNNLE